MSDFHHQKYADFLASRGLRFTRERETIVQAIFSWRVPFDVEELIQQLARRIDGRRVSRSTIYRTLSQLEESGLIRKVVCDDDRDIYITVTDGFHT
jgi:Fur family ferric uptake transcriptional regulator